MTNNDTKHSAALEVTALHWLPTNPPRPCPDLLTDEEAISYLQIKASDTKNPKKTLAFYRAAGKLRGVKIGRAIVYPREELDRFVRALWDEQHPRIEFPGKLRPHLSARPQGK